MAEIDHRILTYPGVYHHEMHGVQEKQGQLYLPGQLYLGLALRSVDVLNLKREHGERVAIGCAWSVGVTNETIAYMRANNKDVALVQQYVERTRAGEGSPHPSRVTREIRAILSSQYSELPSFEEMNGRLTRLIREWPEELDKTGCTWLVGPEMSARELSQIALLVPSYNWGGGGF